MKEISIFVDESGDFGKYDWHSPYYIISMVIHDQDVDISEGVSRLEAELSDLGLKNHCVHAGPLIRGEDEYRYLPLEEKRKILKKIVSFVRKTNIHIRCVCIEKKHINDPIEVTAKLTKEISKFVKDNLELFFSADVVKIYYDNGQVEVSRVLITVFNTLLDNVEFKRVMPSGYRLFQVADLACTLKLIELKMNNGNLSKSETIFFEDERTLRKNYLKVFKSKKM